MSEVEETLNTNNGQQETAPSETKPAFLTGESSRVSYRRYFTKVFFNLLGNDYHEGKTRYVKLAVQKAEEDNNQTVIRYDNKSLSFQTHEEGTDDEEVDEEVTFKPNHKKLLISDEAKLMAKIMCDLNSDPVVVLGDDKLTHDICTKYMKKRQK